MKKTQEERKKITLLVSISFISLLIVYIGISMYFNSHFQFGTVINGRKVSGKTVKEVEDIISKDAEAYNLVLEERDNKKEEIKGTEIGLKYNSNGIIQDIKDKQKSLAWIFTPFKSKDSNIYEVVTIDEEALKQKVDNLNSISGNEIIEPKNASFEYTDDGYKIIEEVYGNKINKELLYEEIKKAALDGDKKINLDEKNLYENPKFTSTSNEVTKAKEELDKEISSKINYTFGDITESLDGDTIKDWLEVNDNLEVTINEQKVRNYINLLGYKYNTVGKTRDFFTSTGKTVKVPGGNYGWKINTSGEVEELISLIKEGKTIDREPKYSQTALDRSGNDYGNSYVEINLTTQHMWYFKDGSLLTEGDIVTGNVANNWATPAGIYRLTYKEKNATLTGENYKTPVNFWMPFNGGIGIHDALWREEFGKDIYVNGGSHGCINSPYPVANIIFDNIKAGDPVICYTE